MSDVILYPLLVEAVPLNYGLGFSELGFVRTFQQNVFEVSCHGSLRMLFT